MSGGLADGFRQAGHGVQLKSFAAVRGLPPIIRHLAYAFSLLSSSWRAEVLLALDTWSVALPAILVGKLTGTPVVLRVGGDYLWEHYIERTRESITLPDFYAAPQRLSTKEKLILALQRSVVFGGAHRVVFTTHWHAALVAETYAIAPEKQAFIENYYPEKRTDNEPLLRNFLWAGRVLHLKNIETLTAAFDLAKSSSDLADITLEIVTTVPQEELHERMRTCYAVVVPSLSEVSPNTVLEALAYSRPVICTEHTGIRERLGDAALFVDPLSRQGLADAIRELAHREGYHAARERARAFTYTRSYADVAREYADLFLTL